MKKLSLLIAASAFVLGANAQVAKQSVVQRTQIPFRMSDAAKISVADHGHSVAKTTATNFYTQTFNGGLPAGWSAGSYTAGLTKSWVWANAPTSTLYYIGDIMSTTAADGWMVYDSDTILAGQADPDNTSPAGYLQSGVINCSTHPKVRLNFEENYRKFFDDTYVMVTSNGGTSWDTFQVHPNVDFVTYDATNNPEKVNIDISSAAGGMATVQIRWVFAGTQGGDYQWMIDDVSLSNLDPTDITVYNAFGFVPGGSAFTQGGAIAYKTPLAFTDSLSPVALISNPGSGVQSNINFYCNIKKGTTTVYQDTLVYASLPAGGVDSIIQFNKFFKPDAIDTYTMTVSTSLNDSISSNNTDVFSFIVTDTTYEVDRPAKYGHLVSGEYYVNENATDGNGTAKAFYQGARFDVPTNAIGDTVKAIGVSFGAGTDVGVNTEVQLYQFNGTNYTSIGSSYVKSLVAADISTSLTALKWAYFPLDPSTTPTLDWSSYILTPGQTYVAVVTGVSVPTTKTVLINATPAPNATGYIGYYGQSDNSGNDGGAAFGNGTQITNVGDIVPLVRMYFGNAIPTAITTVNNTLVGSVYPNPANSTLSVAFAVNNNTKATVTLSNIIGQVVSTQTMNTVSGKQNSAVFNTAALPSGVYIYNVNADGQKMTGRVVVAH